MCRRLELISILTSLTLCFISVSAKIKAKYGPSGMSFNDTTTCVQFSKFARFNPYSVLRAKWFVFYYWAPPKPHETYIFTFPSANHTKFLHKLLDGNTILPVDWSARQILMEDHMNNTSLLVERGDRGEYWCYYLYRVTKGDKIKPRDVRFKQTGDNRILGYMDCKEGTLLAMSRINDVPPKKHLQDEAARLGFRGRRGKSYLYQGHEWMPIPEDDEKHYWQPQDKQKGTEKSSEEVKSSEQSSDEVESQTTKVPEKRKKKKNPQIQPGIDKENCIAIQPEFCKNQENCGLVNEPSNSASAITIEQMNSPETDVVNGLEAKQSKNAPDTSLAENKQQNDLAKESENVKIDEPENHQGKNEFAKASNVLENLQSINEEPKPTNELGNQECKGCHKTEYISTTSESYVPEDTRSRKNLENTPANKPVGRKLSAE